MLIVTRCRYAPETVVLAQIGALRKQRLYQAGVFHAAGASQMEMTQQQGSNMEDYIHCVALLQHLHHKVEISDVTLLFDGLCLISLLQNKADMHQP